MTTPDFRPVLVPSSIVVATRDHVASDLAGEVILLSLETAMYYGLDQVGARVWELVQQPIRVEAIRDVLVAEYEVDAACCEHDLLALLRQLAAAKLIEIRNAGE